MVPAWGISIFGIFSEKVSLAHSWMTNPHPKDRQILGHKGFSIKKFKLEAIFWNSISMAKNSSPPPFIHSIHPLSFITSIHSFLPLSLSIHPSPLSFRPNPINATPNMS
jgi:hypothetical protein